MTNRFDTFKEKGRAHGLHFSCLNQADRDAGSRYEEWMVSREGKQPIFILVTLYKDGSFILYRQSPHNDMAADLANLLVDES